MTYLMTYHGQDGKLDQIPDKPMKIEFDPKNDR